MKNLFLFAILLLLVFSIPTAYAACPGRTEAKMGAVYNLTPPTSCIRIEVSPGCASNSPHQLIIENTNCYKILVYTAQNGTTYEIKSRDNETQRFINWGAIADKDIPQEIGAEWTRELYFKDSPDEKIILSAKNLAIEEWKRLTRERYIRSLGSWELIAYYITPVLIFGVPILLVILVIFRIRKMIKKKQSLKEIVVANKFAIALPVFFLVTTFFGGMCYPFGVSVLSRLLFPPFGWTSQISSCVDGMTAFVSGVIWFGIGIVLDFIISKVKKK